MVDLDPVQMMVITSVTVPGCAEVGTAEPRSIPRNTTCARRQRPFGPSRHIHMPEYNTKTN